jgi:hypothetical protein
LSIVLSFRISRLHVGTRPYTVIARRPKLIGRVFAYYTCVRVFESFVVRDKWQRGVDV